MGVELTALHWAFLAFLLAILIIMCMRRDTTLACILGIFTIGCLAKGALVPAVIGIFSSFAFAINELLGTILVISIIVAMSKVLLSTGVNELMVAPFAGLIRTPATAYWVIGVLMMVISWFFWPSPAAALMGAVLLPIGRRVGLPAIGVAMAMNLFGHGIALSGDWIIQGAPKLTSSAAGIPVQAVVGASVPLVLVMGIVTVSVAFWMLRRDLGKGAFTVEDDIPYVTVTPETAPSTGRLALLHSRKKWLAAMVPALFALDVLAMYLCDLRGGDATALVGGTSVFILSAMSLAAYGGKGLEKITEHLIEGLKFGFTVFGPVIPIAAFFYLGDNGFIAIYGEALPAGSHGLVNDLGLALAHTVPINAAVGAVTMTVVGGITGLDGSGFSGISLAGSLAKLFAVSIGSGIATLTALGQIAAIYVGGGTLIPWSLVAAAAICGVDPFELARRNLVPVLVGLTVTTLVSIFLI